MNKSLVALSVLALLSGCSGSNARGTGSGRGNGSVGSGGTTDPAPGGPDADTDHDGYTPNSGDCDDSVAGVNPDAVELPGNGYDDDCDGQTDETESTCDPQVGAKDATSLAQALEQCDSRFFKGASFVGPSDPDARNVVADFGSLKPQAGTNMILLSTGIAADANDQGYTEPQEGTDLFNTHANPLPNLPGVTGCSQDQPTEVNDYTELVLTLKAPSNVTSFSFNFQFYSTEYPEYVCTAYNDEFLVLQESNGEFQEATNISFDSKMNPITINNGLFTVCTNNTKGPHASKTQNCTAPISDLNGTGYEVLTPSESVDFDTFDITDFGTIPAGGSTGWLTTTAPVTPGEEVTLHFIIFDEGDGILDSAAIIDNFRWGTQVIDTPTTIK